MMSVELRTAWRNVMTGGGGPEGIRTPDLTDANRALSQLSYRPKMGDRRAV
jgi:hypothetical protein